MIKKQNKIRKIKWELIAVGNFKYTYRSRVLLKTNTELLY